MTAGIDFALTIVAELAGERAAEAIQLALECAPAPPFKSGSPEFASVEVLAAVTASMASIRNERELPGSSDPDVAGDALLRSAESRTGRSASSLLDAGCEPCF